MKLCGLLHFAILFLLWDVRESSGGRECRMLDGTYSFCRDGCCPDGPGCCLCSYIENNFEIPCKESTNPSFSTTATAPTIDSSTTESTRIDPTITTQLTSPLTTTNSSSTSSDITSNPDDQSTTKKNATNITTTYSNTNSNGDTTAHGNNDDGDDNGKLSTTDMALIVVFSILFLIAFVIIATVVKVKSKKSMIAPRAPAATFHFDRVPYLMKI